MFLPPSALITAPQVSTICGFCTLVPKGNMFIIEYGGKFDREVEDKCEFMNPCLDQVA